MADKEKDNRLNKRAERGIVQVEAYQKVFKTHEGQLVLDDLMKNHWMAGTTFKGNVKDMLFAEGQRNVILRILKILNVSTKDLRERIEAHERENAE